MKRRIKIISNPEEIQKRLAKLYNKIDMQILLSEADTAQKHFILPKQETIKLNKFNFKHTVSIS